MSAYIITAKEDIYNVNAKIKYFTSGKVYHTYMLGGNTMVLDDQGNEHLLTGSYLDKFHGEIV